MLSLKAPALKKPFRYYRNMFAQEQSYKYQDWSFKDFLDGTIEGMVIKNTMQRDGFTFDLERYYDDIAKKIDAEYKLAEKKKVDAIIKEVKAEQKKLGNYEVYYENYYAYYNNNELVYQESYSRGRNYLFDKGQESNYKKALNERMKSEGYEYYIYKGWVKIGEKV